MCLKTPEMLMCSKEIEKLNVNDLTISFKNRHKKFLEKLKKEL